MVVAEKQVKTERVRRVCADLITPKSGQKKCL